MSENGSGRSNLIFAEMRRRMAGMGQTRKLPILIVSFCSAPILAVRTAMIEPLESTPSGRSADIAEFGAHPLPALNMAGHAAFGAQITGGRATEGIFLAGEDGLQVIALAGDDAPGAPEGCHGRVRRPDAPTLNDNDELAFVANVRRGRDTLDILYFWNGRRPQRVSAELRI